MWTTAVPLLLIGVPLLLIVGIGYTTYAQEMGAWPFYRVTNIEATSDKEIVVTVRHWRGGVGTRASARGYSRARSRAAQAAKANSVLVRDERRLAKAKARLAGGRRRLTSRDRRRLRKIAKGEL